MILRWLKSLFKKKPETKTVEVRFRLPNGKEFGVECYRMDYKPNPYCKVHRSYIPVRPPDTNCEQCWHIYNLKT